MDPGEPLSLTNSESLDATWEPRFLLGVNSYTKSDPKTHTRNMEYTLVFSWWYEWRKNQHWRSMIESELFMFAKAQILYAAP